MTERMVYKYYMERHYSCAAVTLYSCNEALRLQLPEAQIQMMIHISNSLYRDNLCKAYTGCISLIHLLHTLPGRSESFNQSVDVAKAFCDLFSDHLGSTKCRILRRKHARTDVGCLHTLQATAEMMTELLEYPGMQSTIRNCNNRNKSKSGGMF